MDIFRPNRKISEEKEELIIDRYNNFETTREIALSYNCDRSVIERILKKNKIIWHKDRIKGCKDEIIKRYCNGESSLEIAKSYNVSESCIQRIIKDNSVEFHKDRLKKSHSEIIDRYQRGESRKSIAILFNCHYETISRILRKNKIKVPKLNSKTHQRNLERTKKEIRKFNEKNNKVNKIIKLYVDEGKSIEDIRKELKTSWKMISGVLKDNNIKIKSSLDFQRALSDEEELKVIKEYKIGKTQKDIGHIFNVSYGCIRKILIRRGVKLRSKSEAFGGVDTLTNKQQIEICNRYKNGEPTVKICLDYDCSHKTIRKILDENKVEIRGLSQSLGGLSEVLYSDVCKRYKDGEAALSISKYFNVSIGHILRILEINNIQKREKGFDTQKHLRIIDIGLHESICKRYIQGESTAFIASAFGCSQSNIRNLLNENGIELRKEKISKELYSHISASYISGSKTIDLAHKYDVTVTTILDILKKNGTEIRQSHSIESLQQVLDKEGIFKDDRETQYYVYEIRGYPEYLKLGISFDAEDRANHSGGWYGDQLFLKHFENRIEAFIFEQAILEVTNDLILSSDDIELYEIDGYTELRRLSLEEFIDIFDYFYNEFDNLGVWEFAVNYVDMTVEQRKDFLNRSRSKK